MRDADDFNPDSAEATAVLVPPSSDAIPVVRFRAKKPHPGEDFVSFSHRLNEETQRQTMEISTHLYSSNYHHTHKEFVSLPSPFLHTFASFSLRLSFDFLLLSFVLPFRENRGRLESKEAAAAQALAEAEADMREELAFSPEVVPWGEVAQQPPIFTVLPRQPKQV